MSAEHARRELRGEQHVGRSIAFHNPVGDHLLVGAFVSQLVGALAEGQRLGLGEDVRHQDVVVVAEGIQALGKADEVDRHDRGSLVDQLIEAVLAVGARFTPVDRSRLVGDVLAVVG